MTTLDNREVPTQAQVIELALAITTTAVDPAEIDDLADRLTSI